MMSPKEKQEMAKRVYENMEAQEKKATANPKNLKVQIAEAEAANATQEAEVMLKDAARWLRRLADEAEGYAKRIADGDEHATASDLIGMAVSQLLNAPSPSNLSVSGLYDAKARILVAKAQINAAKGE